MANLPHRILVVDDTEEIRRCSEAVLSGCGYEVRTAKDGFEALALLRKAVPDVIISDLEMPNMSGFELLSVVRSRFPHIPVIVITAEFHGIPAPEGLLADAIFEKGLYAPDELFREIRSLLEQSPIRPYLVKVDRAPVWIPRNGEYVVLTCPECLRSFAISEDDAENGPAELSCIHCDTRIRFRLGPGGLKS